jgi:hypothetical protein
MDEDASMEDINANIKESPAVPGEPQVKGLKSATTTMYIILWPLFRLESQKASVPALTC